MSDIMLFDDYNSEDQEFDNINEDSVEGAMLRAYPGKYADRNSDLGKAIRKVDLLNNKLKRGEISKEEFDKQFKDVKKNYVGDDDDPFKILSKKHSKDLLNTGSRSEEEAKDSRQSKEELTGGKVEHYYRNDNMNDTNKKKAERYLDIMASTDNYNDYKEAHKNLAKLLNVDKKSVFTDEKGDNIRVHKPGEEDIDKDSNTKLYHTSDAKNISALTPVYRSKDGAYYPNKRSYFGKDRIYSRVGVGKNPEDFEPDGKTHAYEVKDSSKYKINNDTELGGKARYIETDDKIPVKKFKESGAMSILFDDLNEQEFQEALNQMYENESENKATNLFEQSFEDRIKSAEKTINEDTEYFLNEEEMKRSELPDKAFGVPEQRKYPLIDEKHVRSAIKLFNYVDPKYEEELANNIKKKMKQYKITDITVGEKNRFSKYYNSDKKAVNESKCGIDIKSGWLHKDKNGKWGIEFPTEEEYNEYLKDNDDKIEMQNESYNDFYYTRRDILMEELGEFITETKALYLEKDSKIITKPAKCPKCGSKMGIFIQGEPICKCTNKDCSYYAGTVAFNQSEAKKKCETVKEVADTSSKHFEVKLHDSSNKDKIMFNGVEKDIDDKSYKDKLPIPLEFFPNNMGINLCSVDSMSWDRQKDGQLTNIVIKFIPAPSEESREYKSYKESVDIINEHFPDMDIICTILVEAEEQKDEVKDKVKGKPSPISSEAVKAALESAMEIPDKKKRSEKLRSIMASTVGKLSAKIKYIFGNLKLYDNEYNYDGYIRDLFPKYLDELTAKDLYKLKESIMEHAFTTGRGHKSLKDVINSNQMSSDKDNYMYNLADKVRKDLSVLLHTIDSKYEKARFDGVKPYGKNAPKEEPKKKEKKQEEKKEEEPKKKRRSYWDVDVSEEDEDDDEDLDESADEVISEITKTEKLYTEEQADKIMESYRKYCISKLKKLKELKSVSSVDHGCAIDILFKSDNFDEIEKFARNKIVPIMKEAMDKFTKKYNSKFYWKDKVFTKDGLLIVLDSDVYYDIKESAELLNENAASECSDVSKIVKKMDDIIQNPKLSDNMKSIKIKNILCKYIHQLCNICEYRNETKKAIKINYKYNNDLMKLFDDKYINYLKDKDNRIVAEQIKKSAFTTYTGDYYKPSLAKMYNEDIYKEKFPVEVGKYLKELIPPVYSDFVKITKKVDLYKDNDKRKLKSNKYNWNKYNESAELLEESFKLPKDAKTELDQYKDKINGVIISKDRAKTESNTAKYDFKSKGLVPVAFIGDNEYLAYNVTKKKWCKVNITDDIIFKFSDSLKQIIN